MTDEAPQDPPLAPGRSCAGCTACCKLLQVEELPQLKPMQTWCEHCEIGQGCRIYETRPGECRRFYCGWVLDPRIGDAWTPDKCRMVVKFEPKAIIVYVDKDRRDLWRREPYNGQIRYWARQAADKNGEVIVWEGLTAWRVFERSEERLGSAAELSNQTTRPSPLKP